MPQKRQKIIGLMSGTSADGVDAALIEVVGTGVSTEIELLNFVFTPYEKELRRDLLDLCDPICSKVDRICRLHAVLGEWFAKAAETVCVEAGVQMSKVDLIGCHGQTIHHLPVPVEEYGTNVRSTLQIGDPSIIAERTGVTTIFDFRSRDMAVGGQGAPLVPILDYFLFRSSRMGRVMLNIGGIANLTVLPIGCTIDEVSAFDTGPGNMLIDALTERVTNGENQFDTDGLIASSGQVSDKLISHLMQHPFLQVPPPKSTGREMFGRELMEEILEWNISGPNLVRTVTEFTVNSILDALSRFVFSACRIDEIVVSGGGTENPLLMDLLFNALPDIQVITIDKLGIPSEAKEAVAFAILARETLDGRPGNLPQTTGASHPVVLGAIIPGRVNRI